MVAAPTFTLRMTTSSGALDRYLPDFSTLDLSPVYCDSGTVVFTYPVTGINYSLLKENLEIAVMMNGVELTELRCVIETIEGNDADDAEKGALWKYTCRTMAGQLAYAVVYPANWVPGQVVKQAKPQTYSAKTIGNIVISLLTKAQTRGALTGFTWAFTSTHDSDGNAWSQTVDLALDAGKTYLTVLQDMVTAGWGEFKVVGRSLRLYDTNLMGIDRSVGTNPLRFIKGRDIRESPRKIDSRGLISAGLVAGANNLAFLEIFDADAITAYGRREGYYSAGDIPYVKFPGFPSMLEIVGDRWLNVSDKPSLEVTHGLHFETEDNPRPITNFDVGDWALTDVGQGVERFRILQWVMSVAADGSCTGSITMNFLFNTQLSQVNSAVAALTNGSSNAGTAAKNDGITPDQVGTVTLASDSYLVNSIARATLTVFWPAMTLNEDGSLISDLDYYQVRWKYTSDTYWRANQRIESDTLVALFQNLDCGAAVQVQVRALDIWSNAGLWSATAAMNTAGDTIAPLKPASPVLTSNVGTLRVVWTGLDYLGNAQPPDLAGVEVHISTADFTPSAGTKVDTLAPGVLSTTITQGLTYSTQYWVKLVAVDTTGNRSPASDTTSTTHVVLNQVVGTEIGTGQVGLNNTAFSDVGNLIDDGNFEIGTYRTSRTALMAGSHLAFDSAVSSVGAWSIRSDSFGAGSTEYFTLQDALPVKPGERIFGALDIKATAGATGSVNLDIAWFNGAGVQIDATGAPGTGFYILGGLANTTADNAWHSRVTGLSMVGPPGVATMRLIMYTSGRTTGTIWVDAIEVRRQIDTLLVADLAVTTAKIADLAVNNAKINDLSVGKLTTGTLSADIVVGARIKTADTGQRVEVNSGGIGAWNSGGLQTVAIGSDGSVSIVGTLVSGTSGTRIEINPTGLPTIRFYSGAGTEYGFINGFTQTGTDVGVGFNSSPFTGNSTQLVSRLVAFSGQASVEVIRNDNQQTSGGFLYPAPSQLYGGYSKLGVLGGNFTLSPNDFSAASDGGNNGYLDLNQSFAKMGIRLGISTENTLYFDPTVTRHYGKWDNFITAASNQGLFTGRASLTSGFAFLTISYGATMLSGMTPIVSLVSTTFDNTTGTNTVAPFWGITAGSGSTTSFAVGWDKGLGVTVHFWSFRS